MLSQVKRQRINLISAFTNHGGMKFMLFLERLNTAVTVRFLERLIRDAGRKVFQIPDNLREHYSLKVRSWLDQRKAEIEFGFLPSYSPELNPDE